MREALITAVVSLLATVPAAGQENRVMEEVNAKAALAARYQAVGTQLQVRNVIPPGPPESLNVQDRSDLPRHSLAFGSRPGPILDSALRKVRTMQAGVQPATAPTCQELTQEGLEAGDERGSALWFLGGLFPLYLIPVAPIAAHSLTPNPPSGLVAGLDRVQVRCFAAGYAPTIKSKRIRSSWFGYGVSVGLSILLYGIVSTG